MSGTRHTKKAPRKRSCTLKTPFPTHAAAHRARMRRIESGAAEWTCAIYLCRFCGYRHVGHRTAVKHGSRARR